MTEEKIEYTEEKYNADISKIDKLCDENSNFIELSNDLKSFNPFEMLKITGTEIRHSNILAWLLDPNANHNINAWFARKLITRIKNINEENINNKKAVGKLRVAYKKGNTKNIVVYRERHDTDLLIVSKEQKVVLCIENKVYANEGKNQLKKYRELITKKEYKTTDGWTHYFVFLTKDGHPPVDKNEKKYWNRLSYKTIVKILSSLDEKKPIFIDKNPINDEIRKYLIYYKESIRRNILKNYDQELRKKCLSIYKEHRESINLINQCLTNNKDNEVSKFVELVYEWANANKNIEVHTPPKNSKIIVKFKTTNEHTHPLLENLSSTKESLWGDQSNYYFEIKVQSKDFDSVSIKAQFAINKQNNDEGYKKFLQKFKTAYKNRQPKDKGKNWKDNTKEDPKNPYGTITIKGLDEFNNNESKDKIFGYLDSALKAVNDFEDWVNENVC